MPRERQEFFRESNSKEKERIYILAFEGNVTEVEYFGVVLNPLNFRCKWRADLLVR